MSNLDFTKKLVKGKIAETIFSQMFRESGDFTVLEFGYEKIIPEMIQRGVSVKNPMVETLRTAPDFAVIERGTRQVKLIEVKYQHELNKSYTLKAATRMSQSWNPSYLFIATLDGFFLDEIDTIIKNKGKIAPLSYPQIDINMQNDYLKILRNFEKNN